MAKTLSRLTRQTLMWEDKQVLQPGPQVVFTQGVQAVHKNQLGTTVDDFAGKIRTKRDATSNYEVERVWTRRQPGLFDCRLLRSREPLTPGVERWTTSKWLHAVSPLTLPMNSRVNDIAYGKFLKNIADKTAPFKGGTFLGELRETVQMLRRPASALRDGFSRYTREAIKRHEGWRRGVVTTVEANRSLAGSWLEYSLGWTPLVGSFQDAYVALRKLTTHPKYLRAYGKFEDEIAGSTIAESVAPVNSDRFYSLGTEVQITRQKSIYKGLWKVECESTPQYSDFNKTFGLAIQEFVPTVWELIPYSFVVDYFTNVGDIVNFAYALNLKWVYRSASFRQLTTIRRSQRMDVAAMLRQPGNLACWELGSKPSENDFVHFKRWTPAIIFPTPRLNMVLSPWRWATLYSLVTNLAPRVRP